MGLRKLEIYMVKAINLYIYKNMHILLKDIIKEQREESPLLVQVYLDMDGVLADMETGFKKLSNGLSPEEYEAKNGKSSFWKLISKKPNFWLELKPLPDARILWDYVYDNFQNPNSVILTAGQGTSIVQQKTQWAHKHINPNVKVIVAPAGTRKPEYTLNVPGRVTHVLIDDTPKNIEAWNNKSEHHIAILHKDASSSIDQLKVFLPE